MVWHVLPSIRKELCRHLVKEKKMKAGDAARLLGITDSAVSQYLKGKRAAKFKVNKKLMPRIKVLAERIAAAGKKSTLEYIAGSCEMCREIRKSGMLCDFRRQEGMYIEGCTICIEK